MISIFKRKSAFIDIWRGTPEMHCHVLPEIDDGAKNVNLSLELIEKYKSLGCDRIIATPHTMHGVYDNTPETIEASFHRIQPHIKDIKLSISSEYMVDDNFDQLLDRKEILPLHEKYVLFEMSFFQPPENLMEQIFKMGSLGFIPVLAHPERYAYYHNTFNIYKEFKSKGCLLQLNALSLTSHYGDSCQNTALKLLSQGMYDFIGTDTHHIEHLKKIEVIKIQDKYVSDLDMICKKTKEIFI